MTSRSTRGLGSAAALTALLTGAGLVLAGAPAAVARSTATATTATTADEAVGSISRVNLTRDGRQSARRAWLDVPQVVSAHGRYVAFVSAASDLVPGDRNGEADVFVRDRVAGTLTRVSVGHGPQQGGGGGTEPALTPDGRFVAFSSVARLVPEDTNTKVDVYLRDLRTRTTRLVTRSYAGGPSNGNAFFPALSDDGRYVAFQTAASNLVRGDTNRREDVFVRNMATGRTSRVSVTSAERQRAGHSALPSVSADGRYVLFESEVGDDFQVFVRDRRLGTTRIVSAGPGGASHGSGVGRAVISGDGRYAAFMSYADDLVAGDTNGEPDVFVRDLRSDRFTLVSTGVGGAPANSFSQMATISRGGRYVAFASEASNLVAGDRNGVSDVFVRDLDSGTTRRVSFGLGGTEGNDHSSYGAHVSLSRDGQHVVFASYASNLVRGDTNALEDVFVWDARKPE